MSERTGVVLAAGRARRMGPLGERIPKALLPLGPEPLLFHHLQKLRDLGCERVLLAVGDQGPQIREAVVRHGAIGIEVTIAEVEPRGTAHAVGELARAGRLTGGILVALLGDYGFVAPDLPQLVDHVEATPRSSAITVKREPSLERLRESSAVEVTEDGRVVRIEEKPPVPRSHLRGCGIYVFGPEALDAIGRALPHPLRRERELATGLQLFIDEGGTVFGSEIVEWDVNLTRPRDALEANLQWLERHRVRSLVGRDARLAEGTVLEHAVIGAGAVIRRPTVVREAVVLPGVRIEGGGRIERSVVAGEDLVVEIEEE